MTFRIQNRLQKLTHPGLRPRRLSSRLGRNLGGAIALAGALFVLPACSNPTPTAETNDSESYGSEVAEQSEPSEQASDNPSEALGEVVTFSGEVKALYDENTFVVRDEEYFEADEDILVINTNPTGLMLDVGDFVQVTGEVSNLVLAEIEQDYDITWDNELVKEIEADFVEDPVIIATSVFEEELPE